MGNFMVWLGYIITDLIDFANLDDLSLALTNWYARTLADGKAGVVKW